MSLISIFINCNCLNGIFVFFLIRFLKKMSHMHYFCGQCPVSISSGYGITTVNELLS